MTTITEPGIKKQGYHHGNLRNALLTVAVQRGRERGSEAIVLREIAVEIGVSATAAYRHYRSRDELVSAVAAEGFTTLAERVDLPAVTDSGAVPTGDRAGIAAYAELHNVGVALTEFAIAEPSWTRLMLDQVRRSEQVREALGQFRDRVDGSVAKVVRTGVFEEPDAARTHALRAAMTGLIAAVAFDLSSEDPQGDIRGAARTSALAACTAPLLTEHGRVLVEAAGPVPDRVIADLGEWLG